MQSVKCFQCGFVAWAGAESCKSCGANLSERIVESPLRNQFVVQRDLKKGLAVFSLVLGVLNLFTVGLLGVGAVLGIIVAVVAMNRAKSDPFVYGGKELATAGLITSILSLVIIVPVGIVAAIAIPNLLAARRAANEGATIATLRRIHSAEATYQATAGNGQFGTLEQLIENDLLDPKMGADVLSGYRYKIELTSGLDNEPGFEATSVPNSYPNSGRRSFFVNENGVIRAADARGGPATAHDPALNYDRVDPFEPPSRRLGYQQQPAY
jgi:type II secretory pathway pseudopilin PulG